MGGRLRGRTARAWLAVVLLSTASGALVIRADRASAASPPAAQSTASTQAPRCDDSQPRGAAAPYDGRSVSTVYDKVFRPWVGVPFLDSHVPQALATWPNWDGSGKTLVLLGMYRPDHHSLLIGVDAGSGRAVGTVEIKQSHLGGMGFLGKWLFAQDNADGNRPAAVRRYRIDQLRAAMRRAAHGSDHPFLHADGPARKIDAIDFFAEEGNSVYAGNHGGDPAGRMYRYTLTPDGRLQRAEGPWWIPPRAQGLVITPQFFIFSTDRGTGRGQLVMVRRGAANVPLAAPYACVWIPAMPEDMTVVGGNILIVFESGTKRYAPDHPTNRITHFHAGGLAALLSLTHAAEPPHVVAPVIPPTDKAMHSGSAAAPARSAKAQQPPAAAGPQQAAPQRAPAQQAPVQQAPVQQAPAQQTPQQVPAQGSAPPAGAPQAPTPAAPTQRPPERVPPPAPAPARKELDPRPPTADLPT